MNQLEQFREQCAKVAQQYANNAYNNSSQNAAMEIRDLIRALPLPAVSVVDFGADSTGKTDSSAAFQNAIDYASLVSQTEALRKENENLRKQLNSLIYPVAKLAEEWSEEDGNVIWHKFPIDEPPYVGTPLDSNWIDDYYTHWQPLPPIPSIF